MYGVLVVKLVTFSPVGSQCTTHTLTVKYHYGGQCVGETYEAAICPQSTDVTILTDMAGPRRCDIDSCKHNCMWAVVVVLIMLSQAPSTHIMRVSYLPCLLQ